MVSRTGCDILTQVVLPGPPRTATNRLTDQRGVDRGIFMFQFRVGKPERGFNGVDNGVNRPAMTRSLILEGLCAAMLLAAVGGCSTGPPLIASTSPDKPGGPDQPAFSQFSDIPLPAGAKMDLQRSLVLGDAEAWIGRLVMTTPDTGGAMYDFYFREMPRFNWIQITSVRAETSVLTYTRSGRVATIQITGRTIGGSLVSVTVSPRGRPARREPPIPGTGGNAPVQVMPLR